MGMDRFTIKLIAASLAFILIAVAAIPLGRRFFASDQTRIERAIHGIARGAEKSSPRRILKHFAPDFRQGEITREYLRTYLLRFFILFENVQPVIESIEIDLDGENARVEVWAGCTFTPKNRTEPEALIQDGSVGLFKVQLQKIDRRWYVTRVDPPRMRLI